MIQKVSKKQKTLSISGRVIRGDQYGSALGFPTANLDRREYARKNMTIKFGVYAGVAKIVSRSKYSSSAKASEDRQVSSAPSPLSPPPRGGRGGRGWKAGVVIGPLDKHHLPKIEAHLIGFKGDLYGKMLMVTLQRYLRPFRKFAREEELKTQIRKDIQIIKNSKIKA